MQKSSAKKIGLSLMMGLVGLVMISGPARTETRIQKTFDKWSVNCTETDKKRCAVTFGLINSKNKHIVFSWSIIPSTDGAGNMAVVRTPTGTALTTGITVSFPNAKPVVLAYKTCGPANCIGEVAFNDAWAQTFSGAATFTVTYAGVNGKSFKQDVSLKGFADALAYYTAQLAASGQ